MEMLFTALLVAGVVYFSFAFQRKYNDTLHRAARHPFYRFLAGITVLLMANYNPLLGGLLLAAVFFWIADINLLSTIRL